MLAIDIPYYRFLSDSNIGGLHTWLVVKNYILKLPCGILSWSTIWSTRYDISQIVTVFFPLMSAVEGMESVLSVCLSALTADMGTRTAQCPRGRGWGLLKFMRTRTWVSLCTFCHANVTWHHTMTSQCTSHLFGKNIDKEGTTPEGINAQAFSFCR